MEDQGGLVNLILKIRFGSGSGENRLCVAEAFLNKDSKRKKDQ